MHKFGDIWEEPNPTVANHPWRMQLKNYVAQFETHEAAERYLKAVETVRNREIKK